MSMSLTRPLAANTVGAQVPEKQGDTFDSSINKVLSEIKRDREEQRQLLEDFMKKIAGPGQTECGSSCGPGKCWNCSKPGHLSRNCPELSYNQGNKGRPSQRAYVWSSIAINGPWRIKVKAIAGGRDGCMTCS